MTKNIKLIENIDLDEFKNNLKISRESKNITIEEAAKILHVNVVILKNLENGELDKLANDVFTMGHIRTYLKWLGINSSVIISDYKNVQNTFCSKAIFDLKYNEKCFAYYMINSLSGITNLKRLLKKT